MLKNLFSYPLILVITVYLGILNRKSWVILLFFAEFLLFLMQIITAVYQKINLFLEVTMPQPIVSAEEPAVMEVALNNVGRLPIQKLEFRTEYQCLTGSVKTKKWHRAKEKINVWGRVDSEDTQSYEILSGPFPSGQFLISIPYARLYDYLGIFSIKIKIQKSQTVMVLPHFTIMPIVLLGKEIPIDSESDSTKKGQDPTEIYDIREYQAGDSLRQIYWKRSAGREALLYRENAAQKGVAAVLFFQLPKQKEAILFHYGLKIAGSFMFSLLQRNQLHFIVWQDPEEERLERRLIENEQRLYEVIMELLLTSDKKIEKKKKKERKKDKRELKKDKKKNKKRDKKKEKKNSRRKRKENNTNATDKIQWQESMRVQYQMQFAGEACPEAFFLVNRTFDGKNILRLEQETELLIEFLKGKKIKGGKQEERELEKEMREI